MKTAIFSAYDMHNSESDLHVRSGSVVEIISQIDLGHEEFEMYLVKFPDGTTGEAFADELSC